METTNTQKNISGLLGGLINNIFGENFRPGEEIGVAPSEDQIREKAYLLWEEAGRPEGDGVEFWIRAETDLSNNVSPSCVH